MTVTYYVAEYADATGQKFVGQVFWDKYHQRRLQVTICPLISPGMADYPIWETSGGFKVQNRAEMLAMVEKLKAKALKLGLALQSERETQYAPKDTDPQTAMPAKNLPDPTDKSVIILKGEFAGQEGYCLGPSAETGKYAVTPTASTRILTLHFDEDFGILINKGQKSGRN